MKIKKELDMELTIREMLDADFLKPDDELEIGGAWWRVLKATDHKAVIWKHTNCDTATPFNEDNSNKYEGSDLQKACKAIEIPKELEGLTDGFYPLSIEEVRELLPTEGERAVTDSDGNTVWWWTRSCNRGYGYRAWSVNPSGYVSSYYAAYSSFTCAPACAIQ